MQCHTQSAIAVVYITVTIIVVLLVFTYDQSLTLVHITSIRYAVSHAIDMLKYSKDDFPKDTWELIPDLLIDQADQEIILNKLMKIV